MAVLYIKDFERHRGSPVNGIHVAARRTETGVAAKGNKFKIATTRAGVHGTTKGRSAAEDKFFYILNDRVTRVLEINHFFKIVRKNML